MAFKTLKRVMVPAFIFLAGAIPGFSAPLTWNINGVFTGGGTLSGSFAFDAVTSAFSSISVVATAGGTVSLRLIK